MSEQQQPHTAEELGLLVAAVEAGVCVKRTSGTSAEDWFDGWFYPMLDPDAIARLAPGTVFTNFHPTPAAALIAAARALGLEPHPGIMGLVEAAKIAVGSAKSTCGQWSPDEVDCSAYLDRGERCPDCPYDPVEELETALRALNVEV